jgi:hypothetical protein
MGKPNPTKTLALNYSLYFLMIVKTAVFYLLLQGGWALAECYGLSQPFWSWKMILIGDPFTVLLRTAKTVRAEIRGDRFPPG